MDEKEMNSLHNIIKSERLERENNFRVYYFPEIPLEHSLNAEVAAENEDSFKRSMANGQFIEEVKEKPEVNGQEAYNEGFAKGEREALELGKRMTEPLLTSLRKAVSELEEVKKEICFNAEKETVELALAIAKKIVSHEISTNKNLILNVVKEALKKVEDHDKINIKINPLDYEACRNAEYEISDLIDNTQGITFEEDEKIGRGGCIIETNLGDIDARIEKQINVVEETLRAELKKNS